MVSFQVAGFLDNSAVNGKGLRSVLFLSGCSHNCYNCHNQDMQNPNYGEEIFLDKIIKRIQSNLPLIEGITISGGEPFYQWESLLILVGKLRELGINCWVYSGYTYDELKADANHNKILTYIDVLIAGPFIYSKVNTELLYIGSSNQKILKLNNGKIDKELVFKHV